LTWLDILCLRTADGPADETNVTLTITNTSAEFTKLGRWVMSRVLVQRLRQAKCCQLCLADVLQLAMSVTNSSARITFQQRPHL
jgi:hypothetical protein